jgi:hypothetical protein
MIDVMNERLIDFPTACRLPVFRNAKTDKPTSLASFYRYILRGARDVNGGRVKLEVVRIPAGARTSVEAVERFIRALNDPDATPPAPRSAARKKQIADAEAELQAAGFEL